MTRLLVSVRSGVEAAAALRGGADVVDIKEPRRGSLGAADAITWQEVVSVVRGAVPLSAALGELTEAALPSRAAALQGVAFAKVGLAGAQRTADWRRAWEQVLDCLPPETARVAVAYADWQRAAAPSPQEVVNTGATLGCRVLLVDTWCKTAGRLGDLLPEPSLAALLDRARDLQMRIALAGSLRLTDLPAICRLAPDWIAVRGAACVGGREGSICEQAVQQLSRCLDTICPRAWRAAGTSVPPRLDAPR